MPVETPHLSYYQKINTETKTTQRGFVLTPE